MDLDYQMLMQAYCLMGAACGNRDNASNRALKLLCEKVEKAGSMSELELFRMQDLMERVEAEMLESAREAGKRAAEEEIASWKEKNRRIWGK